MRKTLWIMIVCGLCAALLLSVCSVSAQSSKPPVKPVPPSKPVQKTPQPNNYNPDIEVFNYYEKKDYDPHMPPIDMNPIRFYVQDEHDGTYTLTLTIKNLSNRSWPAGRYQLVCKRGSNYLLDGSGPYWTIEEDVARGETTQIVAKLNQYVRNGRMVFYVLDGQNSFYGFYIRL